MRTDHPCYQRRDYCGGPGRQLPGFQVHVYLTLQVRKGFDQIGFTGDKLPVERVRPAVVDRYLMKFTRPKVDSDVRYAQWLVRTEGTEELRPKAKKACAA